MPWLSVVRKKGISLCGGLSQCVKSEKEKSEDIHSFECANENILILFNLFLFLKSHFPAAGAKHITWFDFGVKYVCLTIRISFEILNLPVCSFKKELDAQHAIAMRLVVLPYLIYIIDTVGFLHPTSLSTSLNWCLNECKHHQAKKNQHKKEQQQQQPSKTCTFFTRFRRLASNSI